MMGLKCKPFDQISETAVRLMIRFPYMMGPYYTCSVYEADDIPEVDTLATNGVSIWVNRDFWKQLSREHRMTAIAHELGHKMLLHSVRRGDRDPIVWNIAGDHVINLMLKESGFSPLSGLKIDGKPWSWCCDDKYKGWTSEAVYDDIYRQYEQQAMQQQGQGGGKAGGDVAGQVRAMAGKALGPMKDLIEFGEQPNGDKDETEGTAQGKETAEQFENRVRKELKEMAAQAKLAGDMPAWMKRAIDSGEHVRVPWHEVLEEYIRGMHRADYAWNRWDRRHFVKTGVLAPDMYQPCLNDVLLFVDVSGSCWPYLSKFNRHMKDIWEQVTPRRVHVRYFQTHVNHDFDQCFERGQGDVIEVQKVGGGGTAISWLSDEIDKMDETPELVIVLTDMEVGAFGRAPDVPVLWLSVSSIDHAPFGDVLLIN
jgi:predicted metal-dependent peptidase